MEGTIMEMEELVKKLTFDAKALRQEKEALRRKNVEIEESVKPSRAEKTEWEPQTAGGAQPVDEE